ncbi:MAG: ferrous iron transport protein B [Lachnospiraceae bacterium]|jgi:ferrous iron transport protein B|nr:ferrous iron transport protein B [Lachnospiraceae bacterium]
MKTSSKQTLTVGFVGNPNCGKTTLFNAFTGASLKVANWPGVTVERVEGEATYKGQKLKLIDLPGIYSLTCYSIEERVSRKCILEEGIDVIVNVVDASSLERNLYLTMQLLELKKPVVLALNMMDIVEERGMEIDIHRLPEMLGGIPVVPVSARRRSGLDVLLHAVVHHYEEGPNENVVTYKRGLEAKISKLQRILREKYQAAQQAGRPGGKREPLATRLVEENDRWLAIKLLENDEEIRARYPLAEPEILDRSYENDIINGKYDYIEEVIEECLVNKEEQAAFTEKIDKVLTHRVWGIPLFLLIMAFVFFLTFTVGDFLKGYFEEGLGYVSSSAARFLNEIGTADWLVSLIVDGIIAGVGGILTFLPNIFILFLALAFLEDSGYMARVAYVMDSVMGRVGLSGKAFLPMLLGFGCTVPAVMATRALESERDRRRTILVTPFMSCSARLPVYVLFAGMFFPGSAMLVAYSLYLLGVAVAILVALVMNRLSPARGEHALLIELPEYKTPNARTIAIYVWEKVKDYLGKAGTTIFIASIILWFLLNYGRTGMVTDIADSFGAGIGRFLVPLLVPAGLGMWQIAVALISGLSAKEVVVSSFSVLFAIGNINSAAGMRELSGILSLNGFGPVNAYAFMVFCLLYSPCMAAVATVRRETRSWGWTLRMVAFQVALAWAVSVLVYQVGSMIF